MFSVKLSDVSHHTELSCVILDSPVDFELGGRRREPWDVLEVRCTPDDNAIWRRPSAARGQSPCCSRAGVATMVTG